MLNEITLGKWEDWLPKVEAQSVRLALLDMPYNTTENEFDKEPPVDLPRLWQELERVLLPDGAVICTASQPFTSKLVSSKEDWFKYDIIWVKTQATGHLNAEVEPMRQHEEILVFGRGRIVYNPQIEPKLKENIRPDTKRRALSECYGTYKESAPRKIPSNMTYPRSVWYVENTNHGERGLHPTQKPEKLFKKIILNFSNPGDIILDCFAGSGTTGAAALATGRNYILIEKRLRFYETATKRLELARAQGRFNFDFEEAI